MVFLNADDRTTRKVHTLYIRTKVQRVVHRRLVAQKCINMFVVTFKAHRKKLTFDHQKIHITYTRVVEWFWLMCVTDDDAQLVYNAIFHRKTRNPFVRPAGWRCA